MTEAPAPSGAEQAARPGLGGLLSAALEALRTRLDLAAVELEIYLLVLVRVLTYMVGAVACALLALAFGVTALIIALWDSHRLLGVLAGAALFVVLAALFALLGTRTLRRQPRILEGWLAQLREDQQRRGDGA